MKNIQKNIIALTLFALTGLSCEPAHGQLQVGDKLPENRMEELKNMSSDDFPVPAKPAQLYLIDFWSIWCGSCIAGFPRVEGLQYQYRDYIRILAINPWNDEAEIDGFFDRYNGTGKKEKKSKDAPPQIMVYVPSVTTPQQTSLPASNGDKSWFDLFDIDGVPHYIWMDENGRILAITGSNEVHAGNINHYLQSGKLPKMTFKSNPVRYRLDDHSLVEVWGREAFPYQKDGLMIRGFYEGKGGSVGGYERLGVVDSVNNTIRYSFVNTPVAELYKAAWALGTSEHDRMEYQHGRFLKLNGGDTVRLPVVLDERLLWEVSMPEYYQGPVNESYVSTSAPGFNQWSFRAKFCVELVLPLEQQKEASRILLDGLNRYFSQELGISARVKPEKRPCLVLKRKENFHPLASTTETPSMKYDPDQNVERYFNIPFNHIFLDYLPYRISYGKGRRFWDTNSSGHHYMPRFNRTLPLLDETGIKENVDFVLHVVPNDVKEPLEALNMRLKGTGLYFEKEIREINMLVISDSVNGPSKAW